MKTIFAILLFAVLSGAQTLVKTDLQAISLVGIAKIDTTTMGGQTVIDTLWLARRPHTVILGAK